MTCQPAPGDSLAIVALFVYRCGGSAGLVLTRTGFPIILTAHTMKVPESLNQFVEDAELPSHSHNGC